MAASPVRAQRPPIEVTIRRWLSLLLDTCATIEEHLGDIDDEWGFSLLSRRACAYYARMPASFIYKFPDLISLMLLC